MTITLTLWKIKLPALLESIPLYKHEVNLIGHPEISVDALKAARLRTQPESGHFEHLLYKQCDTTTMSELNRTMSN